jgi:hypothetical protein
MNLNQPSFKGRDRALEHETEVSSGNLSSIFSYPNLEQLFNVNDAKALPAMLAGLDRRSRDLERVARSGSRGDADRALTALRAYAVVREFLNELEQTRKRH